MTQKISDSYELVITGGGLSMKRPISEAVVHRIMDLVLGRGEVVEVPPSGNSQKTDVRDSADDSVTPKVFMADKRPTTDMERVTCLAYYLTKHRKIEAFKTRELTDLNIEAAQQKLSNPSATTRNAVKYGYLSLAGGGRKQIAARGEALVEALPDREKAQSAIAAHPIRKPRKRNQKRKSK